jgi:hypothetical protein
MPKLPDFDQSGRQTIEKARDGSANKFLVQMLIAGD